MTHSCAFSRATASRRSRIGSARCLRQEAIEASIVTRSIESAQRKVEARTDMRKQLLEYDDVANDQRKVIYQQRNAILDAGNRAQIAALREGCFEDIVRQYVPAESVESSGTSPTFKDPGRRVAT